MAKKEGKKSKTWIIVVVVIFAVLAVIGANLPEDAKNGSSSNSSSTTTKKEYIDVVKELVEKELKNKAKDITITNSTEQGECIKVQYFVTESAWDETDFVRDGFSHYVNVCRDAYTEANAKDIYFCIDGEITDGKGNKETRTLIYLDMPIDKFNTYNWKELDCVNLDYDMVAGDCNIFMIKRPIDGNWNPADFYYHD